jgi:hypothetical protein
VCIFKQAKPRNLRCQLRGGFGRIRRLDSEQHEKPACYSPDDIPVDLHARFPDALDNGAQF